MDTNVRTPQEVFYLPQHLVVPLFQRPYVWTEDEQWLPMWTDITRLAELRLKEPSNSAKHFLGAVVLQAGNPIAGTVPSWNVIDGQQRITTLQLLADAAGLVLEDRAMDAQAQLLGDLTHNRGYGSDDRTLKLVHTNRDRAAFREVMNAERPFTHAHLQHSGALITRAHAFFVDQVAEWLDVPSGDPRQRAEALTGVIAQGLQLVVIDLQAQENSQEIFETLNARGTPLTAADLIKNYIFQRLEAEGGDVAHAYAHDWPFETAFWETEVSVGRYLMTRGSLFLSQWLQSRVGEEISPRQTFVRFKHHVDHEAGATMSDLLQLIKQQATRYQDWTVGSEDPARQLSVPERCFYRMRAGGVELLKPALIWLHDPELAIPSATADEVTNMLESWMVRRQLLRLTSANLGRVVAEIIAGHRTAPASELVQRVRDHLTEQDVASNYWPGDDEVRKHLATEQAYRRYPRGRLRMLLEAVENHLRSRHHSPEVQRTGYPIEHLLPQSWQQNWSVSGLEAEIARGEHVHRLGNLTLLTSSLNSSVSNSAWANKRRAIDQHDVFLLNRDFKTIATWDEDEIDRRTTVMTELLLATWPVPAGHTGRLSDRATTAEKWVELRHLLAAGLLDPGTHVTARPGQWAATAAVVTASGQIELDGKLHDSPSAAGKAVRGGATNGWRFWRLDDGRLLDDVRAAYRGTGATSSRPPQFDWTRLHAILESLPEGAWTTYGALADAIGTAAQPVGNHITSCQQCARPWRVLTSDGRLSKDFDWSDPDDDRDPGRLLMDDGVRLVDGRADPSQFLGSDELTALAEEPGQL